MNKVRANELLKKRLNCETEMSIYKFLILISVLQTTEGNHDKLQYQAEKYYE